MARSKPEVTSGPVPIEVQKQVSAGVRALDGDDEGSGPAGGVVTVRGRAVEEHAILDEHRRDLAGTHAEERDAAPRPARRR